MARGAAWSGSFTRGARKAPAAFAADAKAIFEAINEPISRNANVAHRLVTTPPVHERCPWRTSPDRRKCQGMQRTSSQCIDKREFDLVGTGALALHAERLLRPIVHRH